ncbi:hypothetical protein Gotur_027724 [Gossypium turneri]
MHSLEEFERYNSSTPRYEEEGRCLCLSMYGLVVFPKALRHVDEAVTDLFDWLDRGLHQSHYFWKVDKVSYRVFSENYSPLKEIVATLRRDDISEEQWMAILQNLCEEDVE